jgi:hypothetical protein
MKLRELIVMEDGEGAVATTSSDIATVAYPLFVRGRNKKDKRKNARAAVGQKYIPGPLGIGQGVFESTQYRTFTTWVYNKGDKLTHGMLGAVTVEKSEGDSVFVRAHNDNRLYRVAPHTLKSSTKEAHTLNSDNVIYRLDRENPMSDTEVLVIGGAGRYSLKALRDKARREAAELAQDLSIEHGGAFRRSATNIKQLTNTINTIVAAYNELARIRRKGGRGSRGITDEDTNFIRECIRVVEQATQNYRLIESLTIGNSQNKGIKK